MAEQKYVVLLRGINVGGKNVIAKDDLRGCFEDLGYQNVLTYIQSGTILFRTESKNIGELTSDIEQALSERFSYQAQAVVLDQKKYLSMIGKSPVGWGIDDTQKHNALFMIRGTVAKRLLADLPPRKPDIELTIASTGIVFWSISKEHQTKTSYMKLPGNKLYQRMTIRNHNTVNKLAELFERV